MEGKEFGESFKERMVLVVCFAGTDRSRLVAEELNKRGYVASYGGVNGNHNYVTKEDLSGVGSVIFTSKQVRRLFKQDKRLNEILKRDNIPTKIIGIRESDKERAIQSGNMEPFKMDISEKLDNLGYKKI